MAYQTLYRKWRPKTFDEVIGQPHVTGTLKNEIITGRISHAYIFTGTRGTGKTSTAKILSRALNCVSPVDGNPCNECDVCRGILGETILDVVEMDAASNNGVENIREIIDQVRYATASSKYKVYIIDEVHMLSSGAFNALLKTLEEPPEHVIFILATTEIHKVPPTILSRCQRFDFKNITSADIADAIERIFERENIEAQRDAVEYIAQLGNGSMRDALSIAEQCLAYRNNNLTYTDITEILGTLDDTFLYDMAEYIAKGCTKDALLLFDKCIKEGKSPDSFAEGLLSVMREILVYKLAPEASDLSTVKKNLLEKAAPLFTVEKAVRSIEILSGLLRDLKLVSSPRVITECALARLSSPWLDDSPENLVNRISELEKKLSAISSVPPQNLTPLGNASEERSDCNGSDGFNENSDKSADTPKSREDADKSDDFDSDYDKIIDAWNEIKSHLQESGKLRAFVSLFGVTPRISGGELVLGFTDRDAMSTASEPDNISAIEKIIYEMFSVNVRIRCIMTEKQEQQTSEDNDIFKNIEDLRGKYPDNFKID